MKKLLLTVVLIAVGGCASKAIDTSEQKFAPGAEPSKENTIIPAAPVSLFDEAHRCEGVVKYQAEMQRGEMRSRLSCEWTVDENDWGSW